MNIGKKSLMQNMVFRQEPPTIYFTSGTMMEKGKNYSAECEYRYAMILGGGRSFFGSNKNIVLNAQDAILRDYSLTLRDGTHHIEKVYLRVSHPLIEATCYSSGIEKQYEQIAV